MAAYANKTPFPLLITLLVKTVFGAFILRSSACTINDIFDRDFDRAVGELSFWICKSRNEPE